MSGVSGDFTGLNKLIVNLRRAIEGGMIGVLSQELAATARKQIADEFRQERDPYGNAWEPLKDRNGKILRDTGRMSKDIAVEPTNGGFRITFNASYASVHQNGATIREHSRKAREMRRSEKTNRFVRGSTRTKTGRVRKGTFTVLPYKQHGYGIPRRILLPTRADGGLGSIWGRAFARTTRRVVRQMLAARGDAFSAGGE